MNNPPATVRRKPSAQRVEIQSETYNTILFCAVENPLFTPDAIAALLGRNVATIRAVMESSKFMEDKAKAIVTRYGDKIALVRNKILNTAANAIDAINREILQPNANATPEDILEAAKFLMLFVAPTVDDPNRSAGPLGDRGGGFNVTLQFADMAQIKSLQQERARAIDVTPNAHPTVRLPRGEEERD